MIDIIKGKCMNMGTFLKDYGAIIMVVLVGALGFIREVDREGASIDFFTKQYEIEQKANLDYRNTFTESIEDLAKAMNSSAEVASVSRTEILLKVTEVDHKVDLQGQKILALQAGVDSVNTLYNGVQYRVNALEKEVGTLERKLVVVETKLSRAEEEVKDLKEES